MHTGWLCFDDSLEDAVFIAYDRSPDGASILTQSDDRILSLFAIQEQTPGARWPSPTLIRSDPAPSSLLCAKWFPSASASAPETYCYVRSIRDAPVQLIDGTTGRIRASYPIIDHTERFIGPHALEFSADGSTLYCGYENALEVMDVARPGEEGARIATIPTRKSRDGQKGIISALAIDAQNPSQLVAGSYSCTVGIYDLDAERLMQTWAVPGGNGVTQVAFHPLSPSTLLVASRGSSDILAYDIRNTSEIYGSLTRGPSGTNQRMQIGFDSTGRYLAAGDAGNVHIFGFESDSADPLLTFTAGKGAVGSAAFHPFMPVVLSVCGSRTFTTSASSDSDESSDADDSPIGTLSLWDLGVLTPT